MISFRDIPITGNDRLFVGGVILFFIGLFLAGVFVGKEYQKAQQEVYRTKQDPVGTFIDPLTGCQYLLTGNGVFPRMGQDQRQVCTKHDSKTEN